MPLAPRLWAFRARAERSILCPPSRTRDEDECSLIRFVLYLSSFLMKSFPTLRSGLSLFSSTSPLASGAVYVTERYGTRPGARYKGYEPYNGL
ncbi:hypothetical protein V6N13_019768 [Hibiscus sabdariffa]